MPKATYIKEFEKFKFKIRENFFDENILKGETKHGHYDMPKHPKVVIDIGAHIGGTSILAASLGATVYAYEPEKENFDLLVENVKLNGLEDKIHCFNKGIGNPGERKLYLNNINSGCFNLYNETGQTETVEIISFKQAWEENNIKHCDLLKVDCEGCEYEFIPSIPKEWFKKIDQITMELHLKEEDRIGLIEYLRRFYKVKCIPENIKITRVIVCQLPH